MSVLHRFPKKRPELPIAYQAIYHEHYLSNRKSAYATTKISHLLESWMHQQVAIDVRQSAAALSTLEIGAGTLNHLAYEPRHNRYDIVEPFADLYRDSTRLPQISRIYQSINEITEEVYDRVISIATFEHILDLPSVVAKAATLLKSESSALRVAIPNEGSMWWRWGTYITGLEFYRKYRLDYQVFMRHEHVNTADEIEAVLKVFFDEVKVTYFGFSRSCSLYRFFQCQRPRKENGTTYLRNNRITQN